MAEPTTIAMGVSAGASILGGLMSASGAKASGESAMQMGMFQAGVAKLNAQIARQNANYVRQQGEVQAQRYGMGARARMGEITAQQGASGLDVGSGSAKLVREGAKIVSDMDMNQIRQNAVKAAYDYDVQAQGYDIEAKGSMLGVSNAQRAAGLNVAASIVGSAGSVADKWLQYKRLGAL